MHAKDVRGPTPPTTPSRTRSLPPRHDAPIDEQIRPLRAWGRRHPLVLELTATLPPVETLDPGTPALAWDASPVPGLIVDGLGRVSVLRLVSHTPETDRLVGQIQAVEPLDHPLEGPRLVTYLHHIEHRTTHRIETPEAWFTRVLEAHYEATDTPTTLHARVGQSLGEG